MTTLLDAAREIEPVGYQLQSLWRDMVQSIPQATLAAGEVSEVNPNGAHHVFPDGFLTDPVEIAVENVRQVWCELFRYNLLSGFYTNRKGHMIPQLAFLPEEGRSLDALVARLRQAIDGFSTSRDIHISRFAMFLAEPTRRLSAIAGEYPDAQPPGYSPLCE